MEKGVELILFKKKPIVITIELIVQIVLSIELNALFPRCDKACI